jgi:hypothetical protein
MKMLWAVKQGDEDWKEVLILEPTNNLARLQDAKLWAGKNGFDRLRVATVSDEPELPQFGASLINR